MADLQVVTMASFGATAVKGLFTERRGGVSTTPYDDANLADHVGDDPAAVAANRVALQARLGAPIAWMEQVHGSDVAVVADASTSPVAAVDALVTDRRGLGLGVLVADCVPVLMADDQAGVAAAAHVGRRGLVAGTATQAVATMTRLGAVPARMHVWLGPSICGRCYEVPLEMRAEVELAAPGSATTTSRGTPGVDLRAGLRRQLLAAGVAAVRDAGPCTAESAEHYSHRRDGVTGRFAGVIVLTRDERTAPGAAPSQPARGRAPGRGRMRGGRSRPSDVTLIAVTKTFPADDVRLLVDLGVTNIGENRDQEARPKAATLADLDLSWHFVGQLQANKCRSIAQYADVVHSVDRERVVDALDAERCGGGTHGRRPRAGVLRRGPGAGGRPGRRAGSRRPGRVR